MLRGLAVTIAALFSVATLRAQSIEQRVVAADTITYHYTPIDQTTRAQTGIERFGLRLNDYLTYDESDPRKVRFSAVGGPAYSQSTGWRLSALATLRYRTDGAPRAHALSLGGSASLKGCYDVRLDGKNYIGERHSIAYGGEFSLDRGYLYGLDYAASAAGVYGVHTMRNYGAYVHYQFYATKRLTLGLKGDYVNRQLVGADGVAEAMLEGRAERYSAFGVGVDVRYSTVRTEGINLSRGVALAVEYGFYPARLNSAARGVHEMSVLVDWYQPLWRGGLLALDVYGEYRSEETPWMCRSMLGGDSRMRGYYRGRFGGNVLATAQVELRQRVWEGLVVAGWGGCGSALASSEKFDPKMLLPTYGLGIRWYFNPRSLVRIDYGFGRDSRALIVGYSEAF